MKRAQRVLISLLLAPVAAWLLLLAAYRMPVGAAVEVEGEVLYRFLDLDGSLRGAVIEAPLGNRRVWLTDGRAVYLDARDVQTLWSENPHTMHREGRTKRIRVEVWPTLAGGYGAGTLKQVRSVNTPAQTRK